MLCTVDGYLKMARRGKGEELTWGRSSLLGFWEKARICPSALGFPSPLLF